MAGRVGEEISRYTSAETAVIGVPSVKKKSSARPAMATKTGAPSTSAARISRAIGHTPLATVSGIQPRAKAAGIASSATARGAHLSEAFHAKRTAMRASVTGITHSLAHSGMPPERTLPCSRSAATTPRLA